MPRISTKKILRQATAGLLLFSISALVVLGAPSAAWAQSAGASFGVSLNGQGPNPALDPFTPQNIANNPQAPYVSGGDALTVGATTAVSGVVGCTIGTLVVPNASAILASLGLAKSTAGEVQAQGGFGAALTAASASVTASLKAIAAEIAAAPAAIAGFINGLPTSNASLAIQQGLNAETTGSTAETGAANGVGNAGTAGAVSGAAETSAGNTTTNGATAVATNVIAGVDVSAANQAFMGCIARAIARGALQSIALGTINWINSGFTGNPFYVQNTTQFFRNVADQAAGQFIEGSNLAFLCSPFQLQVQIAVADAYASQYYPLSCSLSDVTNNINGFMNNFSEGGWPAFMAFTSAPSNNPYGAYMGAIGQLNGAVAAAQNQQQQDLLQGGGFLSFQQPTNCRTTNVRPASSPNIQITRIQSGSSQNSDVQGPAVGQTVYKVCDLVTATPGSAISNTLDQTFGISTGELINAQYFDQIISSLVSQLIQKVMYNGLNNLSNGNAGTYGAGDTSSFIEIQRDLLQNIQNVERYAQQLGEISTQNLSDLQSSLQKAETVSACQATSTAHGTTASTTANSSSLSGVNSKLGNIQNSLSGLLGTNQTASGTAATISSINSGLSAYQHNLSAASTTLQVLANFQNQALQASDAATLQNILINLETAESNGTLPSQIDVTNAQEDSLALQSKLGDANATLAAGAAECAASSTH